MKADFSGYATKAGLKCSDGRTITPDAFKHQDKMRVPLVWQHGHNNPENVLGHAILESRPDGIYAYGYFNNTNKAEHTKNLVEHGDINMLSIWANNLIERSGMVLHGVIREVSLVLSGANPGALIENVTIRHSNGADQTLDDEAIIYTGLELEALKHEDTSTEILDPEPEKTPEPEIKHEETNTMSDTSQAADDEVTLQEIYESMSEEQQTLLHFMLGEALAAAGNDTMAQSNTTEGITMAHNVFEQGINKGPVISHDDIKGVVADAMKNGSLKDAVENYALAHGITDIDTLFPEARTIGEVPEFLKRRTEWVGALLAGTRKSPFSRIKTISADLTYPEARAKGYVKGALKKEEFFSVSKRVTTPTTIYKKQKLDRDDVVDITDFDVVVWLKGEMRLMLEEELARAILIGDGRDVSHEDKINEQNIRPIAKDHELYTTTINVNIDDANSDMQEVIDAIVLNRRFYKGTGMPTLYTTETWIAKMLLIKDTTGRRIYKSLEELQMDLRVANIVPVEVMEEDPDLIGVIVNPIDYVIGADKGGNVSMFDDFDIDYNQHKYLIETRVCGALVKLKSAMVVRKVAGSLVLATPAKPAFNVNTGVITIPNVTGVVYKTGNTAHSAGTLTALADGASQVITAVPASGYYFATSEEDSWTFTRDANA